MNWSDDENNRNNIMAQPSRDMPESESEHDEQLYNIIIKTSKNNSFIETKDNNNEVKKQQKKIKQSNKKILSDLFKNNQTIERKFNPRLPPPDKYKK